MGGTGAYTLSDVDRANFKAQGFVVLSNVVEPEALRNEANTRIALEKVLSPALRSDHSCIYEVCPSTLLSETECTDLLAYLNARRAFGLSNAKVL
ncbi:hypothetical protein SARC_03175 [Sphaeroforma arctica JP610]|uniref:Uncharacterized protein n=1 Tax=Sphaeroforma arctica JP610 TaxID=667725 RepID=A0A0L0G8Q7_9EUKA|nr:hypothetical protein, variant [Sphaeroforma arctica JP610]XP_014158510.1 hypothetical protein SARC_03175 [Sphaeroforma arctica JP610]KNC84607.1 hypothetical protein, variant [Sphaeroforma arctica JP610]KNC84608.1 hypothetical protein SARC_03175 [Sphaeroforma arctica JP610]|eukprot:XP_014158509.1 hypothetical protein, variant [Sphaeroforma arctica JP610]